MAFLLVWDKDSYTGRFLVLFSFIYVLQPKLVHIYQTFSLLHSPLPIMASASLRLLFIPIQCAHQPHSSFRFPSLPLSLLFMISP
jgi:hypothetical protein